MFITRKTSFWKTVPMHSPQALDSGLRLRLRPTLRNVGRSRRRRPESSACGTAVHNFIELYRYRRECVSIFDIFKYRDNIKYRYQTFASIAILQNIEYRTSSNALVLHIACDLVPFSKLESQYFRSFVSALDRCYQVPSHKYFVNTLLQKEATRVHSENLQQLSRAECMCHTRHMVQSSDAFLPRNNGTLHCRLEHENSSTGMQTIIGPPHCRLYRPTVGGNDPRVHCLKNVDHCHTQYVEYGEGVFSTDTILAISSHASTNDHN